MSPIRIAYDSPRNVVSTDKKEKPFSIADADSRWVCDPITLHAVNVNSSCFKCPLITKKRKNGPVCATNSKIDVYGVIYGTWSRTRRSVENTN